MSRAYELFIEATAQADERESISGYMAAIICIISIISIILGAFALLFKSTKVFYIAFIIAIACTGGNLLRVFVRNIFWKGFASALIRTCIVIGFFLLVMFLFANIVDLYQFVTNAFSKVKNFSVLSIRYQYAVCIANFGTVIMARIL